jgi:integrase
MRDRFRMFRRKSGIFYLFDSALDKQSSLKTAHEPEARRILTAKNEAEKQPHLNLEIARAYLAATEQSLITRTWADAMEAIIDSKDGPTRERWERAVKDPAFDIIRQTPIVETKPEHFEAVLKRGTVSTNVHLRKLSNYCLDMKWLLTPVLPRAKWQKVHFKEKRGLLWAEHLQIIDREPNREYKNFYELLWHCGGSQSDVASLTADNIDLENGLLSYRRRKSKVEAVIRLGPSALAVVKRLPKSGPLFPHISTLSESNRADAFRHRCRTLGITGVTLHSYRYAFAERCAEAGIPERWSMVMMGHSSKAVHRAYAKDALRELPSLEEKA